MDRCRNFFHREWGLDSGLDEVGGEEIFTDNIRWDDFGQGKVEPHCAVTAGRTLFDKLVENVPVTVGESVPNMLSSESTVLVA